MPARRLVLPALAALLAASCSSGSGTASSAPSAAPSVTPAPTPAPSTATTTAPASTPTSTLPAGVDQVLTFTISGKAVAGPARPKIKVNSTVQLVVTSDRADEIHLHGYDKRADVAAGGTVTLTVRASIPGVFAMELEKEGFTITRLQVQ